MRYNHRERQALLRQRNNCTLDILEAPLPQIWQSLLADARTITNAPRQRRYSDNLYTPAFRRFCAVALRTPPPTEHKLVTFPWLRPKVALRPMESACRANFLAFFTLADDERRRCPEYNSSLTALEMLLPT